MLSLLPNLDSPIEQFTYMNFVRSPCCYVLGNIDDHVVDVQWSELSYVSIDYGLHLLDLKVIRISVGNMYTYCNYKLV